MGALAMLAAGRPKDAIPLLEPVTFEARFSEIVAIWSVAQLQAGNWEAAAKGLSFMAAERSQRGFTATKPYGMAKLARAYAETGRKDEARKAYQSLLRFLEERRSRCAAARPGPRGVRQAPVVIRLKADTTGLVCQAHR